MYWELVDRPNLMIKIPATPAGVPAIETALYEGMNVNVTLLFGVAAYEDVMRAFIRAMERRHAEGLPLDRHSVASFFVSRVDTEVDKRLAAMGNDRAAGARRARERAQRLPGLQARLRRGRVRRAARRGVPGPAPAVGVDRRQEPGLSRDDVRVRPRGARHRQHHAAADAAGGRGRRRGDRRDRRPRPVAGPRGARRRRDRPRRRHRPAPARGHRRVHGPDGQAARRHRGQARGDRHRPPGVVRGRPAAPSSSSRSPTGCARPATRTSCAGSGAATARSGRRPARRSWRTGWAG